MPGPVLENPKLKSLIERKSLVPYANEKIADRLDKYPAELPTSMGELSYVLTRVAVWYLGLLGRPLKAKDFGDVIALSRLRSWSSTGAL